MTELRAIAYLLLHQNTAIDETDTRLNAETCMKLFHYLFVKKLDILEVNNSVLKKKVTMVEPYKL